MTKGEMINAVYKANLTKRATLVVFYLINRADKEMTCFPGIKTIGKECNMSTRTVQRALTDLVEAGFLKKESRFHEQGGQRSNLYILMIAEKECDNTPNDIITFDSYVNDRADEKKEEIVDGIESNIKKVSSREQVLKNIETDGSYKCDGSINDVMKTCFLKSKILFKDYCRGG